ncbi:MAG: CRISPR-associated ring nuclease Crn3/Csx3 [Candidatus Helarchaeota archaeon]
MKELEFDVKECTNYTVVTFKLNGALEPVILKSLQPPDVNMTKGVVLNGRGPIWLYCFLTHHYHPTKFLATSDPRLGGAVIVESHAKNYRVGDVLTLNTE